ncbi:MAG TPA: hypothetical protein VIT91_11000 [Chthoniobacterales bacterium]
MSLTTTSAVQTEVRPLWLSYELAESGYLKLAGYCDDLEDFYNRVGQDHRAEEFRKKGLLAMHEKHQLFELTPEQLEKRISIVALEVSELRELANKLGV